MTDAVEQKPAPTAPKEPKEPQERLVVTEHSRFIGGKNINVADWVIAIGARRRIIAMFGLQGGPASGDMMPPEEEPTTALRRVVEQAVADREGADAP